MITSGRYGIKFTLEKGLVVGWDEKLSNDADVGASWDFREPLF